MDFEGLFRLAKECGFTDFGKLSVDKIELRKDVRDMCEVNRCGRYGHSWACPPGCGDLSECEKKLRRYKEGIIVQVVGQLEDEFDGEAMMEAQENHKNAMALMHKRLKEKYTDILALGAGTCTRCKVCAYPDAPCRFPDEMTSSMEAFGMWVSQVCKDNGVKYSYGKNTIAYTGCFLINE